MDALKRSLIERAQKEFKSVRPCRFHKDFSNSFTEEKDSLIFWFNDEESKSTHILVQNK